MKLALLHTKAHWLGLSMNLLLKKNTQVGAKKVTLLLLPAAWNNQPLGLSQALWIELALKSLEDRWLGRFRSVGILHFFLNVIESPCSVYPKLDNHLSYSLPPPFSGLPDAPSASETSPSTWMLFPVLFPVYCHGYFQALCQAWQPSGLPPPPIHIHPPAPLIYLSINSTRHICSNYLCKHRSALIVSQGIGTFCFTTCNRKEHSLQFQGTQDENIEPQGIPWPSSG